MKLVYLAGPYSADAEEGIWDNIKIATIWSIRLWSEGYAVLCPHLNTAGFHNYETEETGLNYDVWIAGDLEMLKRCDMMFVMPGWEESKGTQLEIGKATEWGIPVKYLDPMRDDGS